MTANKAAPIAAVSLLGAVVLCLAFDFLVSSFFLVTIGRSIPYSPGMTFKLWQSYGLDPVYSARLAKISGGLLFVATVGVAMARLAQRNSCAYSASICEKSPLYKASAINITLRSGCAMTGRMPLLINSNKARSLPGGTT